MSFYYCLPVLENCLEKCLMKDYNKNKESLYLQYWDGNNSYGWAISQKLLVNNFEWIEDTSQFNEDFIKIIMKKVMKDIFSKLMFNILNNYMNFITIYHFYQKELKLKKRIKKKVESLLLICMIKLSTL